MAALPENSSAWSACESAVMEEKPLMKPSAETSSWILVPVSITAGSDQALGLPSKIALNTSGPPMRSSRYSSHIMDVQRDWPPREKGATPMLLKVLTSDMTSSQVLGGWTPAFWKSSLL